MNKLTKILNDFTSLFDNDSLTNVIEPINFNLDDRYEDLDKLFGAGKIDESQLKQALSSLRAHDVGSRKENDVWYTDAFVFNEKGELLLLKRNEDDDMFPGVYCLPGGKVEFDETPVEAVIRETREETNIEILLADKIAVKEIENGRIYYFFTIAKDTLDSQLVLDNEEHQAFLWCSIYDLTEKKVDLIFDLRETIIRFLEQGLIQPIDKRWNKETPKECNPFYYGSYDSPYSFIEDKKDAYDNGLMNEEAFLLSLKTYMDDDIISKALDKYSDDDLRSHARKTPKTHLEKIVTNCPNEKLRQHAHLELKRRELDEEIKDEDIYHEVEEA